jgi:molybdopterin molybdotransferase
VSEPRGKAALLHPDEALRIVESASCAPEVETVPLSESLGRALAHDLPALVDQPPFDKSAMDGFAYGDAGQGSAWRMVELLPAGAGPSRALGPGECARIMTGAPLPPGARAVQRVEWTSASEGQGGDTVVRFLKPEDSTNVIRRAENQSAGERLLDRRILGSADIGILASSGYSRVPVVRRPLVGILSTGDEIAEPGSTLPAYAIYDSNGPLLAAASRACGCDVRSFGIARDEPGLLDGVVSSALRDCDVLLVSGGVSVGDFDYVPRALEAAGVRCAFHGLAMRPGRPTFYGRKGDRAAFGLPGNPVSVFVNFEILVKAHLHRRMGLRYSPRFVSARLASPLSRKTAERVDLVPASLEVSQGELLAKPLPYRGSSMLSVLSDTDALLRMEIGEERIEKGRTVLARLVRA